MMMLMPQKAELLREVSGQLVRKQAADETVGWQLRAQDVEDVGQGDLISMRGVVERLGETLLADDRFRLIEQVLDDVREQLLVIVLNEVVRGEQLPEVLLLLLREQQGLIDDRVELVGVEEMKTVREDLAHELLQFSGIDGVKEKTNELDAVQ